MFPGKSGKRLPHSKMLREEACLRAEFTLASTQTEFNIRVMRSNALALILAAGAMTLVLLLCVIFVERAPAIPPDFQFQSSFSRAEAEIFYAKAKRELRQSYWAAIGRDLRGFQFSYAWTHFKNGEGHVQGVVGTPNNDVMAFVNFSNGNSYWITIQQASDRILARRR